MPDHVHMLVKYTAKIQRGPICGIFEREIGADDIRQTRKLKI